MYLVGRRPDPLAEDDLSEVLGGPVIVALLAEVEAEMEMSDKLARFMIICFECVQLTANTRRG